MYFKIIKKLDHFTVDLEYEFDKGVLVIQGESGAGKNDHTQLHFRTDDSG